MAGGMRPYIAGCVSGVAAMATVLLVMNPGLLSSHSTSWSLPRPMEFTAEEERENIAYSNQIRPRMLLTTVNSGFLPFTMNWLASIRRSGIRDRVVIVAEDTASFKAMLNYTDYPGLEVKLAADAKRREEGVLKFSSDEYINFVNKRPAYISHFLKTGFDVIFSDVDIVLFQDPFPYFNNEVDINLQVDVWKKDNHNHSDVFCAGFVFYRATNATLEFLKRLKLRISAEPKIPDQILLNRLLRDRDVKKILRTHAMNGDLFVSGRYYFNQTWRGLHTHQQPVMVHNNWITKTDQKLKRFKDVGLWYL